MFFSSKRLVSKCDGTFFHFGLYGNSALRTSGKKCLTGETLTQMGNSLAGKSRHSWEVWNLTTNRYAAEDIQET